MVGADSRRKEAQLDAHHVHTKKSHSVVAFPQGGAHQEEDNSCLVAVEA